ncbi:MAG: hypothetical protein ACOX6Y_09580 [Christensenellales bacterium]
MALYARWEKRRHPHQYITNIVAAYITTLSASAFTLLPLAGAFHAFSLAGLLISPVAIAGVGLLMVLYLAGLLISLISLPLAQFVAWPIVKLTQLYESMVAMDGGAAFCGGAFTLSLLVAGADGDGPSNFADPLCSDEATLADSQRIGDGGVIGWYPPVAPA